MGGIPIGLLFYQSNPNWGSSNFLPQILICPPLGVVITQFRKGSIVFVKNKELFRIAPVDCPRMGGV